MVSTSSKIDQILALVQELSERERVGLVQRIVQMFLPAAEPAPLETYQQANGEEESIFSVHPQRHLMLQEQAAFDAMIEELKSKYLGQYVAVHQGGVIDHDMDITALANRTGESHPNQIVLIRQVLSEPEPELRWRSVRLVDNL